jgi:hypothetical protein
MFLGGATYTSRILEHPEAMDLVEDPFVIVIENRSRSFLDTKPWQYDDMASVMTLMHAKGWETVNITFEPHNNAPARMVALFKNPRAKRKNQPDPDIEG